MHRYFLLMALACCLHSARAQKAVKVLWDEKTRLTGLGYENPAETGGQTWVLPAVYPDMVRGSGYDVYDAEEWFIGTLSAPNLPADSLKTYEVFGPDGKILHSFSANGYFTDWFPLIGFRMGNKTGVMTREGKVLVPAVHQDIIPEFRPCNKSHCPVAYFIFEKGTGDSKRAGLLNATGQLVLQPVYERLDRSPVFGLILARHNGRYGWLDAATGREIIALQYDGAEDFSYPSPEHPKQFAVVAQKNEKGELKWGIIDAKGRHLVPCTHNTADEARQQLKS